MPDMGDMLRGVDEKVLAKGMQEAKAFANTEAGKALAEKLKGKMPTDKDALLKMLAENPEIIRSVEKFLKG